MKRKCAAQLRRIAPCMLWVLLGAVPTACGDPPNFSNSTEIGPAAGTGGSGGMGTTEPGTGGAGGSGAAGGAGAGGSMQVDDPCASLTAPGAPDAHVVWVTGGDQSLDIATEISLLWSFQYAVRVPQAGRHGYSLVHERCATPAGGRRSCSSGELALSATECSVSYAPKFGVDPSQYAVGKNIYEFKLRLMQGDRVASADAFTIELTYAP